MNKIYNIVQQDNLQVVNVSSLFNELENRKILDEVSNLIEQGSRNFRVDLSSLPFLNSVGLNCLLSIQHKSMKVGGSFSLQGISPQVLKLLEITKLKSFFSIVATA